MFVTVNIDLLSNTQQQITSLLQTAGYKCYNNIDPGWINDISGMLTKSVGASSAVINTVLIDKSNNIVGWQYTIIMPPP